MRCSILIAAHNEGRLLARTIESCIETSHDVDYEIVVADDASTDDSLAEVARRFPNVRVVRSEVRQGASPTKSLAARNARGETLVFLDGHCKPEHGAIRGLIETVEALAGDALIVPSIAGLDSVQWKTDQAQIGIGYWIDLLTLSCNWKNRADLESIQIRGSQLYVSPGLIGCVLAIDRRLYDRLWGFDPLMRYWGVEDLDFGLKCWTMGHQILVQPKAVVGHRFRSSFDNYQISESHIVVNQLRMARKNFTQSVWEDWVEQCKLRSNGVMQDHPEGIWARAWTLFESDRASVEQERAYLLARRTRDEFWYAKRFDLQWPSLKTAPGVGPLSSISTPSAGPSHAPSPSPAPCKVTKLLTPSPLVFVGQIVAFTAQSNNPSSVQWNAPAAIPASGSGQNFSTKWTSAGTRTITAACGSSSISAVMTVVNVTGVLSPVDNFVGRSTSRFGIGETINLSFLSTPSSTAAQLGGLKWFVTNGGGSIAGGADGTGVYTCPPTSTTVQLVLKVVGGPNAGRIVNTQSFAVVTPTAAVMQQSAGTGVRHTNGDLGVGFKGSIFMRPLDVSFINVEFSEGTAPAVASGFWASLNGAVHPASAAAVPIGGGNSTSGCMMLGNDTVDTGDYPPPFSNGSFLWAIPWQQQVGTGTATVFMTAHHFMTASAAGVAQIQKAGAGPFTKNAGDPTSTF